MSFLRPSNHQNRSRNMGEGPLNRKPETARGILQKITKITIYCSPHFRSPLIAEDAMGVGSGWRRVPFNHALKRGSWLFCDGRLYKYKRGSECFCFGRGKGKKEENLLSVVVFRQYNTIDYTFWTKQHSTIQQWILPRSLTLYYPFSYHQSPFF